MSPRTASSSTPAATATSGSRGTMADLFFLVLSKDDRTHLRVLARLARLFLIEDFIPRLR